jgi:thymidine kinase
MSLELIIGPMFSGKTKALLRRVRELEKTPTNEVLCITHLSDDRYSSQGDIVSHDGDTRPAHALRDLMSFVSHPLFRDATHIAIEEAQFFHDLAPFVRLSTDVHKKHLVCAGLDGDFMREPFGQVMELVPLCDHIQKLKAHCSRCSEPYTAIYTARLRGHGSEQVLVGATDIYKPMCREHYLEYYYH